MESLSQIWGHSIKNDSLDYAIHVIAISKEGCPPFTAEMAQQDPDTFSTNYYFHSLSGQHRAEVLLNRIKAEKNLSREMALLEDEAVWLAHIYSEGLSYNIFGTLLCECSFFHAELLCQVQLCSALMVIHNTPVHLKQSTVLEKVHAFTQLRRMESISSEDLESFYTHIRGNITSNFLLECSFHPSMSYQLECLLGMIEVANIPQSTLLAWTRAGPNHCHAAGVSVFSIFFWVFSFSLLTSCCYSCGLLSCNSSFSSFRHQKSIKIKLGLSGRAGNLNNIPKRLCIRNKFRGWFIILAMGWGPPSLRTMPLCLRILSFSIGQHIYSMNK